MLSKCPVCGGKGTIWAMSQDYYGIECWKCVGSGTTLMLNYQKERTGSPTDVIGDGDQII